MDIKVCDRCGCAYDPFKQTGDFVIKKRLTYCYLDIDLCPKCYRKSQKIINNFMKNKE